VISVTGPGGVQLQGALVVFFLIPALYGVTSQGMAELHDAFRRRTANRRRRADADQ